jgi:predicted MPP superfamily phosphohydrolase
MNIERQLIFIFIFISVFALTNYYVYRRFFCKLTPVLRKIGGLLILMLMAGETIIATDIIFGYIPDSPTFYMTISICIGATFILFVFALIYDLIISTSQHVPFNQQRRQTIKVIFDITMLIAAMSYLWRGFLEGTRLPEINDVVVRIKDFPLNGFTIVQLTDIHVGRTIKRDFLQQIVERTNAVKPDIVVITGDLFDLSPGKISHDLEPLESLDAPTYFVTGNHEYFNGIEAILEKVRSLGITPLNNTSIPIGEAENSFNLVGLSDLTGERFGIYPPDTQAAYTGIDQTRPTIVLSHQPKSITLVENKRCDLMLCGHTHGGQIFPFGLLVMLDQPYLQGLHEFQPGKQIFVSRGTGYWGPPLRVMAPSEISRIVITQA